MQRQGPARKLSDKPHNPQSLLHEWSVDQDEAREAVRWILSTVAWRPPAPGRRQKAIMHGEHVAYFGNAPWMRGSDMSERIYASLRILNRAGLTKAFHEVAELLPKKKSWRGRPRKTTRKPDFLDHVASVRAMYNDFEGRCPWKDSNSDYFVNKWLFAWFCHKNSSWYTTHAEQDVSKVGKSDKTTAGNESVRLLCNGLEHASGKGGST